MVSYERGAPVQLLSVGARLGASRPKDRRDLKGSSGGGTSNGIYWFLLARPSHTLPGGEGARVAARGGAGPQGPWGPGPIGPLGPSFTLRALRWATTLQNITCNYLYMLWTRQYKIRDETRTRPHCFWLEGRDHSFRSPSAIPLFLQPCL